MNYAAALGNQYDFSRRKVRAPQGMMPGNSRGCPLKCFTFLRAEQTAPQKIYRLT